MTSDVILERLTKLHPKIIDLDLKRMVRLLPLIGNPDRHLPPLLHVAGTNGKGSVIAYLRAILEAAGYRVHVYTSPHLVRFHERIRLAGELIKEEELADLLLECEKANGDDPITFFEVTTAAAFLAFTRHPADILLLETGLGGRCDATNVVARPLASVITSISMDHKQFLGNSLAEIATEKAGIIKPGYPVVIAPQSDVPLETLTRIAMERGSPIWAHGQDWEYRATDDGFSYEERDHSFQLPSPALAGRHQLENAATAIATLRWLEDFRIDSEAMRHGIAKAEWPARMQRLQRGPLVDLLPSGWELWLDGGHNPDAAQAIAMMIEDWKKEDNKGISLVFGMLNTKEPAEFLQPLAPLVADLSALAIPGDHASLSAQECAYYAEKAGIKATAHNDPAAAVSHIIANHPAGKARRILICGSLYLAGKILAENS